MGYCKLMYAQHDMLHINKKLSEICTWHKALNSIIMFPSEEKQKNVHRKYHGILSSENTKASMKDKPHKLLDIQGMQVVNQLIGRSCLLENSQYQLESTWVPFHNMSCNIEQILETYNGWDGVKSLWKIYWIWIYIHANNSQRTNSVQVALWEDCRQVIHVSVQF